ncbi:cell wall anchor protein [Neobacillus sp. GCM10023253]|uniref:cell wall anchor protein n=1 Tax=Neobacillus sp. GCM10023253 TaxID=3252644 RepID=UPI00360D8CDB
MVHNVWKKGAIVAALGLSLSAFSPIALTEASAATTDSAQKLVDSLKALGLNQVDYLYAYLQSVNLTDSEFNDIVKNAEQAAAKLQSVSSPENLSDADRAEVGRLFLDSAQKAHLQVAFVDKNGKAIDLSKLSLENAKTLNIQVKDLNGNLLAVIDPKLSDFTASALNTKLVALKTAVEAKKNLEASGKFVPMPASQLPNTATDLPLGMAIGGLLIVLGGIAFVPAMRTIRRMESQA